MFDPMCVMNMFSFRYTYQSLELCQVIVRHFVTLTEDSTPPASQSSRTVVQRLEDKFCIVEESMVSVVCLCVHRNRTSSVIQGKETKYIMILCRVVLGGAFSAEVVCGGGHLCCSDYGVCVRWGF